MNVSAPLLFVSAPLMSMSAPLPFVSAPLLSALVPMRSLDGHAVFLLLVQLALLIAVARVGAELAKRLGLPAVVGELAAGIALGPTVLGHYAPETLPADLPARRRAVPPARRLRQRRHGAAAAADRARDRRPPAAQPRPRRADRVGDGDGAAVRARVRARVSDAGGVPGRPAAADPVRALSRDRDVDLGDAGHRQDPGRPGSHQAQHRPGDPVGRRGRRHRRLADPVADRGRGLAAARSTSRSSG